MRLETDPNPPSNRLGSVLPEIANLAATRSATGMMDYSGIADHPEIDRIDDFLVPNQSLNS